MRQTTTNLNSHNRFIKILLLLACLYLPGIIYSQGWQHTFGGQWRDVGRQILQTNDGGYLVAGESNSFSGGDNDIYVIKTNSAGIEEWSQTYGGPGIEEVLKLEKLGDGYVIGGITGGPTIVDNNIYVFNISSDGTLLWELNTGDSTNQELRGLTIGPNNNIFITGTDNENAFLRKLDSTGNELWTKEWTSGVNLYTSSISTVSLSSTGQLGMILDTSDLIFIRSDLDGNILHESSFSFPSYGANTTLLEPIGSGSFLLGGEVTSMVKIDSNGITSPIAPNNTVDSLLRNITGFQVTQNGGLVICKKEGFAVLDPNYEIILNMLFPLDSLGINQAFDVIQSANGGFVLTGSSPQGFLQPGDLAVLHTDASGNIYSQFISGNVYKDLNDNCSLDNAETGVAQIKVKAEGVGRDFYALSDSAGNYLLNLDTGSYQIQLISNSPYTGQCDSNLQIDITLNQDTTYQDIGLATLVECPYMEVDIATPFLRRCFDTNYYIVNYCNHGSIAATNASVEVKLDTFLTLISAELPFTMTGPNTYSFELGNVEATECNYFRINVKVSCDAQLGQAHCTEAYILPDTICTPTNPNWSGASIMAEATCEGDSVKLTLRNIGNANMNQPLNYIVIEDVVMYMAVPFQLNNGEAIDIHFPANGATYQIIADQEPGHPGTSNPFAGIEGCVANGSGSFSTGFLGSFPLNDSEPFVDIDCTPNIGAFDPNDKQGFPIGYGDKHYIYPNTSIEYLIRFQNTGTDTAFNIVVRDTISDELDMESFLIKNTSHPYQLIVEEDNILVFKFNNIQLPDSNINEIASHGFIKFEIAQKADLPDETIILNKAAIYFDYNEPIITNETDHTVSRSFLDLTSTTQAPGYEQVEIKVFPNPTRDIANISIEGIEGETLEFHLYDLQGKLQQRQLIQDGQLQFYKGQLSSGMYFYQIYFNATAINSGKLIIH